MSGKIFCPALTKLALDLHVYFCLYVCMCMAKTKNDLRAVKRILYDLGFKFEPAFGPGSKLQRILRSLMEFSTFLPSPKSTIDLIVR